MVFGAWLLLPRTSLAATLYLSPSSGSFPVGTTFTVTLRTDTQGAPVNTAEATVNFSASTLELAHVSGGSNFPLQTPGSPSQSNGSAFFSGGIPTPGYTGSNGVVGSMTFRATAVGAADLTIVSGKVLLNDGQGTDALSGTSSAHFTITPPPVGGPQVTSTTDPDPNSWYATSTVIVSWNRPNNAYGFSFQLDQNPSTIPDNILDTTITQTHTYTNVPEGTSYFHIKAKSQDGTFGATTHFQINVDTHSPEPFQISLAVNSTDKLPIIQFETKDDLSGIGHYEVLVDGASVQKQASSPFTLPSLGGGSHNVEVVAYDKAGNSTKAQLQVMVSGSALALGKSASFLQKTLQVPAYVILALLLVIILLFIFLIIVILRRRKQLQTADPVAAIQAHVDASLEDLKLHISQELASLSHASLNKMQEQEERILGQINSNISKTRAKVDSEISQLKKKRKKVTDEEDVSQ